MVCITHDNLWLGCTFYYASHILVYSNIHLCIHHIVFCMDIHTILHILDDIFAILHLDLNMLVLVLKDDWSFVDRFEVSVFRNITKLLTTFFYQCTDFIVVSDVSWPAKTSFYTCWTNFWGIWIFTVIILASTISPMFKWCITIWKKIQIKKKITILVEF